LYCSPNPEISAEPFSVAEIMAWVGARLFHYGIPRELTKQGREEYIKKFRPGSLMLGHLLP
jgi:hypothetical protein